MKYSIFPSLRNYKQLIETEKINNSKIPSDFILKFKKMKDTDRKSREKNGNWKIIVSVFTKMKLPINENS